MSQPKTREELLQALRDRMPKSGELWKDAQDVIPRGLLRGARCNFALRYSKWKTRPPGPGFPPILQPEMASLEDNTLR